MLLSLCKEIVEERGKVSRLSAENIAYRKLRWKYCETQWKYRTLRYTSVRWKETHNLKLKYKFSRLNNNNLNTKYSIELLLLNKTLLNIYYLAFTKTNDFFILNNWNSLEVLHPWMKISPTIQNHNIDQVTSDLLYRNNKLFLITRKP